MKGTRLIIIISIAFILISGKSFSQVSDSSWTSKYDTILKRIRNLEKTLPGLNEKITNSVTDVKINEFLRAIAISAGVNISIDPRLNFQVINNFNDVKVSDILLFLCDQYRFDILSIGNIIIIKQIERSAVPNKCIVQYDPVLGNLSLEVDDVELGVLSQRITDETRQNVIPASGLFNQKVRTYVQNMPFSSALDKVAYSNNLLLKSTDDGYFLFESKPPDKVEILQQKNDIKNATNRTGQEGTYKLSIEMLGRDSIRLYADKAPISTILKEISNKSGNDFIMASVPQGEVTLQLNSSKYQDVLRSVLSGTDHIFKNQDGIYIIGNKSSPNLMNRVFVQLQYRAVDSVLYLIPKDLIGEIDTRVFREQNSIMLSGPTDKIAEVEKFIQLLDRLVPVVSIEVMIIDYNASYTINTGITAGLGPDESPPTSGRVFPSIDINLNSRSINDLINRFNGFGWAKIGKVTPVFYAQLKALESQGVLNIRSTPILSTLNGHQTKLSIGKTEYYLEEQFNIIGTQNPQSTKIETYKPVEAELAVIITPIVSGDEQITLEIEVTQSDFTERISKTAPPGKVSRTFKSQIRVKNEEMILLGGLEENKKNQTSSGTPLLSRIPILKWIFSNRTDETSKSKLNIFVKPTIIN